MRAILSSKSSILVLPSSGIIVNGTITNSPVSTFSRQDFVNPSNDGSNIPSFSDLYVHAFRVALLGFPYARCSPNISGNQYTINCGISIGDVDGFALLTSTLNEWVTVNELHPISSSGGAILQFKNIEYHLDFVGMLSDYYSRSCVFQLDIDCSVLGNFS